MLCGAGWGAGGVGVRVSCLGISAPHLICNIRYTHNGGQGQNREDRDPSREQIAAALVVVPRVSVSGIDNALFQLVLK